MDEEYKIETTGRLLKIAVAARALSVSEHTLRIWMMQGRVRYTKLGRASRISEYELHRLQAEGDRLSQS